MVTVAMEVTVTVRREHWLLVGCGDTRLESEPSGFESVSFLSSLLGSSVDDLSLGSSVDRVDRVSKGFENVTVAMSRVRDPTARLNGYSAGEFNYLCSW